MHTTRFDSYIAADPVAVWRALTDPERTPSYFFGLRLDSTWEPGSTVTFGGAGPEPLTGTVRRAASRRTGWCTPSAASPGDVTVMAATPSVTTA